MDVNQDRGIDGFETSKRIRVKDTVSPIYAYTGSVDRVTSEKCIDLGLNGVFFKPLDPERFILEVVKLKNAKLSNQV